LNNSGNFYDFFVGGPLVGVSDWYRGSRYEECSGFGRGEQSVAKRIGQGFLTERECVCLYISQPQPQP